MSFALVCLLLAVGTGIITEILPIKSEFRPVVPKVFGLLAVTVGISYYHVSYEEAIGVFGASLASASVAGLVKYTLGFAPLATKLYAMLWGTKPR
jgi:hypothetical protein